MRLIRKVDIVSLTVLNNEEAEIIELIVPQKANMVGKRLAETNLPKGINIGTLVKGDKVTIPRGNAIIEAGDRLVMFVKKGMNKILEESFSAKTSEDFITEKDIVMG